MFSFFKLSKFFLYTSVFAVTIVSQSTIFPFVVGKFVWFRTSIDLAFIFFLIGILKWQNSESIKYIENFKKVFKSPINIAILVFVLMYILAGIFGVDPHNSFWSNFVRGEGGFEMLHFYALFLLLSTMFLEKKQWVKIFYCSIFASIISISYGVLAGLGIGSFLGPPFSDENFRLGGAIGNPAYLATYLIFIIFYILYIIFTEYRNKLASLEAIKIYIPLVVVVTAFFGAATRGAIIGLAVATCAFLIYLIFTGKKFKKTFMTLVIGGMLIFGTGIMFKDSVVIKKLPFSRIFDISFSAKTFQDRTIIWKMAWDGFKKKPIFGYGSENFARVFEENFNTAYYNPSVSEFSWFDRAHSIIFDYLAETGLLGLMSFMGIFGVYYWQFFKTRINATRIQTDEKLRINTDDKNQSKYNKIIINQQVQNPYQPVVQQALLFALPIAYLVQGLVLFDTLPVYLNLFLFFAFAYYVFSSGNNAEQSKSSNKIITRNQSQWIYQIISGAVIICLILAIFYGSVLPYVKAKAYQSDIMKQHTSQDFKDRFNSIYDIQSPIGNEEISLYLVESIGNLVLNPQNQSEDTIRSFVDFIRPRIDQNEVTQLLSMARIYSNMWENFGNEEDYKESVKYYLQCFKIAPKLPPVLYGIFSLHYKHGDVDDVKNIGNNILQYWPQDDRINKFMNEINKH